VVVDAPVGKPVAIELFYDDFDGPGPYTFKITQPPTKGAVTGKGPVVTYASKANVFGEDSFKWVVNDGQEDSAEAAVTIRLAAPNVAPVARDQQVEATAGRPSEIALEFSDPDEQPGNYRFLLAKAPANGTATWQSYNRFTYLPNAGFVGTDRFTWKVNDGASDSNVATATVTVRPDTEPPEVVLVDAAGPNNRVRVAFSESVSKDGAENLANYAVDNGVKILKAELAADGKSVALATSELTEGVAYSLTVANVRDCAAKPNVIKPGTRRTFNHVFVGNGLFGEYYKGKTLDGEKTGERIDPFVDFNWRRDAPFPTMKVGEAYSVRWTGRLKADHTEEYMIDFFKGWEHNRNPIRIWVDGKLLANESAGGATVEAGAFGRVNLEPGKVHDLKIELNIVRPELSKYADQYALRWSSLSTPKQVIPQSNLGTIREAKMLAPEGK